VEEASGAPHGGTGEFRYPGTCRDRFQSIEEAEAKAGRSAGLRLRSQHGRVAFVDLLHGQLEEDVEKTPGDFLILRRDKTPAYHLAVVLDDAADGVAEVVRGDDLLASTGRQVLLAEKLHLPPVNHAHVPLVQDAHGQRLAKRDHARALRELRAQGVPPTAIVAWAAVSANQVEPGLRALRASELIGDFDLRRVGTASTLVPERAFGQER
jgi:glutamyl-tRNA synthetase